MKRSWSPKMVRAMPGHGCLMQTTPETELPSTSLPSLSLSTMSTPRKGSVALPGLVGVAPAKGVMTWPPVSVCVCGRRS